jgi:hypothetical protein
VGEGIGLAGEDSPGVAVGMELGSEAGVGIDVEGVSAGDALAGGGSVGGGLSGERVAPARSMTLAIPSAADT